MLGLEGNWRYKMDKKSALGGGLIGAALAGGAVYLWKQGQINRLKEAMKKQQAIIDHNNAEIEELKKQKQALKLFDFENKRKFNEQINLLKEKNCEHQQQIYRLQKELTKVEKSK